jgi:segregation and condensation protein B
MTEVFSRNVVEAALLAAGRSLTLNELAQLFDPLSRPTAEDLRATLAALTTEYEGRGIELKETAAGYRVQVRKDLAAEVSRLWPERPAKYSRALLETLALIAYRQPLTRAEIEAVRGVAVNPNIIKTLLERNWIRVVGHRDLPGHPELLGTTREFLDYFGLKSLDQLPPLAELKALSELDPQMALPEPLGALAADEAVPLLAIEVQVEVVETVEAAGNLPILATEADGEAGAAGVPEAAWEPAVEPAEPAGPIVSAEPAEVAESAASPVEAASDAGAPGQAQAGATAVAPDPSATTAEGT